MWPTRNNRWRVNPKFCFEVTFSLGQPLPNTFVSRVSLLLFPFQGMVTKETLGTRLRQEILHSTFYFPKPFLLIHTWLNYREIFIMAQCYLLNWRFLWHRHYVFINFISVHTWRLKVSLITNQSYFCLKYFAILSRSRRISHTPLTNWRNELGVAPSLGSKITCNGEKNRKQTEHVRKLSEIHSLKKLT